ncbi:carbamoyltransferase HypF [Beijerinckiaceae bacterium]|nr:carbamoyltransferase HypF [Beijerinckiaceae bacterium]
MTSSAIEIRVRGRVQGVGFRPTVWRLARELGLAGEVLNDAAGVLIRVRGSDTEIEAFINRIKDEAPPLARVEAVETCAYEDILFSDFRVTESLAGSAHTEVSPDAAICAQCAKEILLPGERRFNYAFTTCTHCGPRLSILNDIPYDRAMTTMAEFPMCPQCRAEYDDPADRRFHAEAIACADCGPRVKLLQLTENTFEGMLPQDEIEAACELIAAGEIVAVKGLGGYQIACDATNPDAIARLRRGKRRDAKPFALMARDLRMIRRYCAVNQEEEQLLGSPSAPIVLLRAKGPDKLPEAVAPGLQVLGFMLPTTPLHLLILQRINRPLVMTSGNISDEPQVIDDAEARDRLSPIASYALTHDRPIANRLDDSVARIMAGTPRVMRRARGYAPEPLNLPEGFETAPDLLAMGGELKATFCLVKDGSAILSQHQGDLEHPAAFDDYRKNLELYGKLFDHAPSILAIDQHPEYLSSKMGDEWARRDRLPLIEVQHHHAHVSACLAENSYPLAGPPVLGIVLDGLGWGDDGTIWGGEFLIADYQTYRRMAALKPVAMPGGASAVREPWRNLYAHLTTDRSWSDMTAKYGSLNLCRYLARKPLSLLDSMIKHGLNAPKASSCGRLFDAVAAALDLSRNRQAYEGEAAMLLEAIAAAGEQAHEDETSTYPLDVKALQGSEMLVLDPSPMWDAILVDLMNQKPAPLIAGRFHKGLALAIVAMAVRLAGHRERRQFSTVALSGGCFQNRILFEAVMRGLETEGFVVLSHARVPTNDGGLALGQAAIAAAKCIGSQTNTDNRMKPCALESLAVS